MSNKKIDAHIVEYPRGGKNVTRIITVADPKHIGPALLQPDDYGLEFDAANSLVGLQHARPVDTVHIVFKDFWMSPNPRHVKAPMAGSA